MVSILIVMVVVLAAVVSMPVSLTAVNPDATDSDMDVFRDDDRVIAGVHRTGKGRHRQERNETKNKHGIFGILHGTLSSVGDTRRPDASYNAGLILLKSVSD